MTRWTRSPRRTLAGAVSVGLVSLALFRSEPAAADIGVWSLSETSGEPGELVDLFVACGGCVPGIPGGALVGPRLPVSLLPLRSSLYRRQCPSGLCTPTAPTPPAAPPYLPLGVAVPLRGDERTLEGAERLGAPIPDAISRHGRVAIQHWLANMNRLRFQIPDAKPGPYKFVIYCRGCVKGPEGALIQTPSVTPHQRALLRKQPEELLRISPMSRPPAGDETGETWWLLAGVGLTALTVSAIVAVRRFWNTG
jgi:hypothetical protein